MPVQTPYARRIRMTPSYTERLNPEQMQQPQQGQPMDQMLAQLQQQQAENNARFGPRGASKTSALQAVNPVNDFIAAVGQQFQQGSVMAPYQRMNQRVEDIRTDADMFRGLQSQAQQFGQLGGQFGGGGSGGGMPLPTGGGSDVGSRIVAAAQKYLGTPYSWGGGGSKGPTRGQPTGQYPKQAVNTVGFDCSGLVQYAYAQVGIKMPRVSYGQLKMGGRAAIGSLRPGDLVGFGNGHHIAIYVGGGKVVEAPRTGLNVRVRSLSKSEMKSAWGVKVYH